MVALLLPGRNLLGKSVRVANAAIQALAAQNTQFDLGDVEPAAGFGGVVDLQFVREPLRFSRAERLVELSRRVGIQVVHYQHASLGCWVARINTVFDTLRPIHYAPTLSAH